MRNAVCRLSHGKRRKRGSEKQRGVIAVAWRNLSSLQPNTDWSEADGKRD